MYSESATENDCKLSAFFIFGTTAEHIKISPVVKALRARGFHVELWSTGQQISELRDLKIIDQCTKVISNGLNDESLRNKFGAVIWFFITLPRLVINLRKYKHIRRQSVVLVHGDTLTTLLGALSGFFTRFEVAHIEAGLRSGDWKNPFPEELTRRIVGNLADIHFCPNSTAASNLRSSSNVLVTNGNTAIDALALDSDEAQSRTQDKFALVVLHRNELLSDKTKLALTISALNKLSHRLNIVWVTDALSQSKIQELVKANGTKLNGGIFFKEKQHHHDFLRLMIDSEFVLTDSGGIQEECAFLGKTCFVYRNKTERLDGIGGSVTLLGIDPMAIEKLINENKPQLPRKKVLISPSIQIAEYLLATIGSRSTPR